MVKKVGVPSQENCHKGEGGGNTFKRGFMNIDDCDADQSGLLRWGTPT